MSADHPDIAPSPPKPGRGPNRTPPAASRTNRSRVSNGKDLFLGGVDQRSSLARRYRDVLAQLVSDIGGDPSEAQTNIARRAATLSVWCEQVEADMAASKPIDIGEYTTATNTLRRLLADLGLERRLKDIDGLLLPESDPRRRPEGFTSVPLELARGLAFVLALGRRDAAALAAVDETVTHLDSYRPRRDRNE